jgi:hypothetical protein
MFLFFGSHNKKGIYKCEISKAKYLAPIVQKIIRVEVHKACVRLIVTPRCQVVQDNIVLPFFFFLAKI